MQEAEPLPIVEDDQQLYDWGIEHRLDQYYGGGGTLEQQQQYQYQQAAAKAAGYVLPDHVQQQENAYLVSVNGDQKTVDGPAALQAAQSRHQMVVKTESSRRSFAASSRHPNIKPNGTGGVPGRRPMLPTVDMDANELMKVKVVQLLSCKKTSPLNIKHLHSVLHYYYFVKKSQRTVTNLLQWKILF